MADSGFNVPQWDRHCYACNDGVAAAMTCNPAMTPAMPALQDKAGPWLPRRGFGFSPFGKIIFNLPSALENSPILWQIYLQSVTSTMQ
jgi:hypothetical protein